MCNDWVCPWVAAIASMQVRATLLNGSCAVSDQPDVCECVRRDSDFGFLAPSSPTNRAQIARAARILAISMKKFMPIAQKKLSLGAKASMSNPAATPARRYSRPSARV